MILVTGSTGLLGSHVLIELSARGHRLRALKRKNSDVEMVRKLFRYYHGVQGERWFDQIEWAEGDILDVVSLQNAIKGCDVVYHCAAMVSFRRRDFKKLVKVNKTGTSNVVNVCLSEKADHLVYVSSTAAIGRSGVDKVYNEQGKWISSPENSGYAITKYSAETEVWRGVEEGLNAVIINPSVILGPGNWNESSLSIFKVVKKGLRFYTSGVNAFVDVRDVARAMAELSERRIFNDRFLIIGDNLSYRELFNLMADTFHVKRPSIEVKHWMAGLAWRLEGFLALFGRKQNITRETARSSMQVNRYSNEKIRKTIGFEFTPMSGTVENAVRFFNETF